MVVGYRDGTKNRPQPRLTIFGKSHMPSRVADTLQLWRALSSSPNSRSLASSAMFVAFSGLLIPASLDTSQSMTTVAEDVVQAASSLWLGQIVRARIDTDLVDGRCFCNLS